MAVAAALAVAADRRLVQSLLERGATSPATAVSIDVASRFERQRLVRLESLHLVRRLPNDTCYLDEEAWAAYQTRQRKAKAIMLIVALVLAAGVILFLLARSSAPAVSDATPDSVRFSAGALLERYRARVEANQLRG